MTYDVAMSDGLAKMSWRRAAVVAMVMWLFLAGATGLAAWRIASQQVDAPQVKRLSIPQASVVLPVGYTALPTSSDHDIFLNLVRASSDNSIMLLAALQSSDPVPVQELLPEVARHLLALRLDADGDPAQRDQVVSHEVRMDPGGSGPLNGYLSLLVRRGQSPVISHDVIGVASPDEEHHVIFVMRFNLPASLANQPLFPTMLDQNVQLYRSIARTIELHEAS